MAEGIELASLNSKYFCHHCTREVYPIHTTELTCPDCSSEFLEEISQDLYEAYEDSDSDHDDLSILNSLSANSLTVSINNLLSRTLLNVADNVPDVPESFEESEEQQQDSSPRNSFRDVLLGLDENVDGQFLRFRDLGDYMFGDDLDALAAQLMNDAEISGPPPLPKEQIKLLPTIAITKEHIEKGMQCTVCMDDFHLREKAKCLPCEHFYHEKCITPWLERHATCPNCRKLVDTQSRNRRSRSCPRASLSPSNDFSRRFSESTSLSDFFTTSMNPFRFL